MNLREGLLAFVAFGGELSPAMIVSDWLAKGRSFFLPRVAPDGVTLEIRKIDQITHLMAGYRGIQEPSPTFCRLAGPYEIDMVLVPGLAFDGSGTRLGRGGGHYDRMLERLPREALRVGICHEFQLLPGAGNVIPREAHDAVMDYVCTPSGLLRCDPGRRLSAPPDAAE